MADESGGNGDKRVTPPYKFTFSAVLGIMVVTGIAYTAIALAVEDPSVNQAALLDTFDWAFRLSLGGFFGLIAGKAL